MSNYQWIENYVPGGHASNMGALLDSAYLTEYGALFRTLLLRAKSDAARHLRNFATRRMS